MKNVFSSNKELLTGIEIIFYIVSKYSNQMRLVSAANRQIAPNPLFLPTVCGYPVLPCYNGSIKAGHGTKILPR